MDELTEALAGSFSVSSTPNNPDAPHPRFTQYKQKRMCSQEDRRQKILEAQKQKRFDFVNHVRNLVEGDVLHDSVDEDYTSESMDTSAVLIPRPPRRYSGQLMMSEWLVEKPTDLEDNWTLKLCPQGRRNFVIAANGKTRVYAKNGYLLNTFPSMLPGGCYKTSSKKQYTLLDCIFNEQSGTYYILDVMCWNCHEVYESETEFRFFWLQIKCEETQMLSQSSHYNKHAFVPLPFYSCIKDSISNVLAEVPQFSDPLDGLLFYHKQTHYTCGTTPLVGWLKAYMVPELLEIPIAEFYWNQRPSDYLGMQNHFDVEQKKSKHKRIGKKQNKMEVIQDSAGKEGTEATDDMN